MSRSGGDDVLDADAAVEEETVAESNGDDSTTTTATPTTQLVEPSPPPTTAPADDVVMTVDFGDETWELTHGELNAVVIPSWENQEFVTRAFGGSMPPAFYSGVANEHLIGKILDRQLVELEGSVDDASEQEARDGLFAIMQQWFPTSDDPQADVERMYTEVPYLPFVVSLQSRQGAVESALTGSDELKVEAPCVRHILLDEEAEAQDVVDLLDEGADFSELAAERSTGPSGPTGGDLGCAPSSNYVPEFAAAVDGAELGVYIGPVQTQFGWHVLVVDRLETSDLEPAAVLNQRVGDALGIITVEVDPRIGSWDPNSLSVVPVATSE